MVGRPTYPSVPPIDGNVPVSLSWESKQARTLVWYGKKKIMRKSFQFDEHDELTAETVEAQVRGHHMFAEVLEAHSPTDQSVGESSAAAASDAATLEASFPAKRRHARQERSPRSTSCTRTAPVLGATLSAALLLRVESHVIGGWPRL